MNARTWCLRALLLVGFVAFPFFTGCSDPNEPEQKPEEIVNSDKPNSNTRVLLQTAIGEGNTWSTIWRLVPDNLGGNYFRGGYNSNDGVGRVNGDGSLAWFSRAGRYAVDLCALSATASVPNGLVVAAKQDVDNVGGSDVGYVSLFSPGGSLLNELVYSADTCDVWLNSIVPISDSTFVVVGGWSALDVEHPFVATVELTPSGLLEKGNQVIIDSILQRRFGTAVTDASQITPSEVSFYALSSGTDARSTLVHKISLSLPTLSPWTVDWSREVTADPAHKSSLGDVCFFENNLYVTGRCDNPSKQPVPSDGGYWQSGLIASLTLAGDIRWIGSVSPSSEHDAFYEVAATPGGLYAIGFCSVFSQSDQYFGYGLISKMASATFNVISNMSFGKDSYQSGFHDGFVTGGVIRCGGWTMEEGANSSNRAWYCVINALTSRSMAASSLGPRPGDAGESDGTIADGHRNGAPNGFLPPAFREANWR